MLEPVIGFTESIRAVLRAAQSEVHSAYEQAGLDPDFPVSVFESMGGLLDCVDRDALARAGDTGVVENLRQRIGTRTLVELVRLGSRDLSEDVKTT